MADQRNGGIAWTDLTVNPIRARAFRKVGHHCVKVSPGCANCYASRMQPRFGLPEYELGKRAGVEPFLDERALESVLRRRKPARIFWCDMTDLFGDWVSDAWIDRCFAVMALTPQHTHQVLTKRPERMQLYCTDRDVWNRVALIAKRGLWGGAPKGNPFWPLPNVWLGVSVDDQQRADERIPLLLHTPAAVRYISAEPLLGPLDLRPWLGRVCDGHEPWQCDDGCPRGLDWVIVGGESGPDARPCNVEWIRDIVRQCRAAGVACFVKQLGARPVYDLGDGHRHRIRELRKAVSGKPLYDRKGADPSEWPEDLRVRQFPNV